MVYNFNLEEFASNDIVQIHLDHQLSYLHLYWKQHPSSEQFRNGYRVGVYLALKFKINYWLADARNITYLAEFDQSWLSTKMRPLLKSGKLKKYAIIMKHDCFLMTQHKPNYDLSVKQQGNHTDNFHLFVDQEMAHSWLFSGVNPANSFLVP